MTAVGAALDSLQIRANSKASKILLLVVIMFIIFVTSGVPFNWASLVVVLKGEGIYSDLCRNNTTNGTMVSAELDCREQDLRLNLSFTSGLLASYCFLVLFGFFLDWRGPRLTFTIASLFYLAGATCFMLSTPGGFDGIFPGQILMQIGTPPIFMGILSFTALIPEKLPTISSLMNTTFDASVFIYHLFNLLWTNFGITHNISFAALVACGVGLLLFALLWPRNIGSFSSFSDVLEYQKKQDEAEDSALAAAIKAEAIPEPNYRDFVPDSVTVNSVQLDEIGEDAFNENVQVEQLEVEEAPEAVFGDLPFFYQLQQPEFWLFAPFHYTFIVWQFVYMGTAEIRAVALTDSPQDVEYYVSWYGWVLSGCIVLAPAIGFMIEKIGIVSSFLVEHLFTFLWVACLVANDAPYQIPAYIFFGIARAIYYSLMYIYILRMFGEKNLGKHWAVLMGPVGVMSMVQYPILDYVLKQKGGDWLEPSYWFAINCIIVSIMPIYVFLKRGTYKALIKGM